MIRHSCLRATVYAGGQRPPARVKERRNARDPGAAYEAQNDESTA